MPKRRLLILDDDERVARTMQLIAETCGFEVHRCEDPGAILAAVREFSPSHIALDLVMPGKDGVEVLGMLAKRGCDANVILSSGLGGRVLEAAGRSAREHGLCLAGLLPKPFTAARLRSLLTLRDCGAEPNAGGASPRARPAPSPDDVAAALERGEIHVAYQPKFCCATGALAGYEALARWVHPRAGAIPPGDFVPVAERSGLIDLLTDEVLRQALAWFGAFARDSGLLLAVNLSARTICGDAPDDPRGSFVDRLAALCGTHGVRPDQVVLELTETCATYDPVASLDVMTRLRVKGFELAIDDFGTGFSTLQQLVRLPFTEVKIDRSFVSGVAASAESRSVLRAVIDLARSLGLRTVAEGVEDATTFECIRELACDQAQGFFLAHPLAPHEAAALAAPGARSSTGQN